MHVPCLSAQSARSVCLSLGLSVWQQRATGGRLPAAVVIVILIAVAVVAWLVLSATSLSLSPTASLLAVSSTYSHALTRLFVELCSRERTLALSTHEPRRRRRRQRLGKFGLVFES